uniref:Uncharacterized protein n=1 Tax=Anguilla anguilla TaxID=7936 RepID=A0A0E9XSE4_ANGAN
MLVYAADSSRVTLKDSYFIFVINRDSRQQKAKSYGEQKIKWQYDKYCYSNYVFERVALN